MKIIADTHTHTLMSGHAHSTVQEMVAAAKAKGLQFLAITDHTGIMPGAPKDVYFACLCSTLPEQYDGVYLLLGCEVNIIDEDGTVDLPASILKRLDWVIASIHSYVTAPMDVQQCTKLWTAIAENPDVDVIGHCVEYCNGDTDTYYAQMRRENGFEKPFGIKTWCLGNKMGGLMQICRKTPEEYGRLAAETGKIMKLADPSIELVACVSSHKNMPRFGEWELTVLEHTYDIADYLSIHQYFAGQKNTPEEFLGKSVELDAYIQSVVAMCDAVKAKRHSSKTMYLSFDEWNVFADGLQITSDTWEEAPVRFEYTYSLLDALVVGCMMMTLQNHCDRIKIACLAQLVNAIAPIMTETGGRAWAQTTYYPFLYASRYGRGQTLCTVVKCDTYDTSDCKQIPYLECAAVHSEEKREIAVFTVNRSLTEDIALDMQLEDFGSCNLLEHLELYAEDIQTTNTADFQPVKPVSLPVGEGIVLKKHSWNMLRFQY